MEDSKVKLSLEDFKELIKSSVDQKEESDELNADQIFKDDKIVDEDTIDWSPWFKSIYGR